MTMKNMGNGGSFMFKRNTLGIHKKNISHYGQHFAQISTLMSTRKICNCVL